MKIINFFLFLLFLTTSCTKDEDVEYDYQQLIGTWEVTKFDIIPIDYGADFDWNQNMNWNYGNERRVVFLEKHRVDIINKIDGCWISSLEMYDVLEVSNRGFFTTSYNDYSYILTEKDGSIVFGLANSKLNKIYQMHCKKISNKYLRV